MKILLTGGGTAGHIFPLVALVREIKKMALTEAAGKGPVRFFYVGPRDAFARELLEKEGVRVREAMAGKVRRYLSLLNLVDLFVKLPIGLLQSFYHIFVISPDVIFSKGGYGSLPTVVMGKLLLVPIFLHESDSSPGLANRIAGRFALEIFTAFPVEKTGSFSAKKLIAVGNPLRQELLKGSAAAAKKHFKLVGGKPLILLLGGSQGAQNINDKILVIIEELLEHFEVIHQIGRKNFTRVKTEAAVVIPDRLAKLYHPVAFLSETELAHAYQAACLVVSRAGAGSIFELAALGKPSILIPLAGSAQNHQVHNAYAYAETGATSVLEEPNLTPYFLLERLKHLFSDSQRLAEMRSAALAFARPEAARITAEYLMAYLTQ